MSLDVIFFILSKSIITTIYFGCENRLIINLTHFVNIREPGLWRTRKVLSQYQ